MPWLTLTLTLTLNPNPKPDPKPKPKPNPAADLITTVTENAYFGRCTSTTAVAGVALVKTAKTLLVATWTDLWKARPEMAGP